MKHTSIALCTALATSNSTNPKQNPCCQITQIKIVKPKKPKIKGIQIKLVTCLIASNLNPATLYWSKLLEFILK